VLLVTGARQAGQMPLRSPGVRRAVMAVSAAVLAADQVSKSLVLKLDPASADRVPAGWIGVHLVRNTGASYGIGSGDPVLITFVALAAVVIAAVVLVRTRSRAAAIFVAVVLGGGAGNLADRLLRAPGFGRGAVVDFIDLQHFADFNVADICLTCGVVLVVLLSLRGIPMTGQSGDYARSAPA
jgi:signal peptidase II